MQIRKTHSIYLLLSSILSGAIADSTEPEKTTTVEPCTAKSTSGAFFNLSPDIAIKLEEGTKPHKSAPSEDYYARGYDYGYNFTLNICAAVVKPPKEVVGLDDDLARNVSAYYESKGKVYSLGQQSSKLTSRGRQLVLQYTGGSPCGAEKSKDKRTATVHQGASYKYYDYDDEEYDSEKSRQGTDEVTALREDSKQRRKSATISFLCDRESLNPTATASFISADPDECAYWFVVRSQHACAGAQPHTPGSVGPGSVFVIIFFIALLVYFVGGVFYQRTVAHARGWRQLPNYTLWAGIWNFIKDMFIILTSSCSRFLPSRRGYRTLSISPNGRGRNRDDENRLIDQLDEEWDD
ncbi:putative vacuolar sorting receptor protein [Phaeoacremonium minimum UCRPA7]|uniref:Putative vacuolar sorting receptor protein n=1 Tax=Phaeoacremonium minimum (strain UCR-PA7) TaxID=1286976 RepID=R8BV07_PHAM7|nr:putative vacuolar sorting receptor protein [Phaeoacremonium minimum UCRPA7]EOO03192.1 putative vacuolar sorting receptor protein [Phaeoacremonium minimum UCRPA7]